MDIEELYAQQIGEFGPAQKKLFVILSLPSMWMGFHVLVTNFVGTDPGWTCTITTGNSFIDRRQSKCLPVISDPARNCSSTENGSRDCQGLPVIVTDPEEKCRHYENGDCLPQFDTSEYTSIVSEVSNAVLMV